jgi:SAM-dependent methyltransferase
MKRFVPLPGAEVYVALQRTTYQHPITQKFQKKIKIGPFRISLKRQYNKWLLPLIESRRADSIFDNYYSDMEREYLSIAGHLPGYAGRILDIGCGIGGIDVFLHSHYRGEAKIHLLDRSGISDNVYYGFSEWGAYYNSLDMTCRFLSQNGISTEDVVAVDVERDPFPAAQSFDLVLSILSWGYHYPLTTYLDAVHGALAPGGTLIVDLRRNTPGKQQLTEKFGVAPEVVVQTLKFERVVLRSLGPDPGGRKN